ncbi:MAG: patatin-like phospholipase family protein [Betaproteobacteria bacterium]|jgi:predicted acylesterase/phospholipase RssA
MSLRLALLSLCVLLSGCAALLREPVPVDLMGKTTIPGLPEVRATAGERNSPLEADLIASFAQESPADFPVQADGRVHYSQLILSGGGANGAFGAGLLNGWSAHGTRPKFKIVTGVSTGALMAPYAFLGAEFDPALKHFYTTTDSRRVFLVRSVRQILSGESLADTGPLADTLNEQIDAAFLERIAAEHRRGRRLYVATTDLDAQRFVIWNLGAIAASGHPQALDFFRRAILASASIPVVFPPVFFQVEADGRRYDEMHVDGAVGTRMFYNGGLFDFAAAQRAAGRTTVGVENLYVIHNGQLRPVPAQTPRTLRGIGARALASTGKSAAVGDLFRIYVLAQRGGGNLRWITLPAGVEIEGEETFDPVAMTALFEVGYALGAKGPPWIDRLPGFSGDH